MLKQLRVISERFALSIGTALDFDLLRFLITGLWLVRFDELYFGWFGIRFSFLNWLGSWFLHLNWFITLTRLILIIFQLLLIIIHHKEIILFKSLLFLVVNLLPFQFLLPDLLRPLLFGQLNPIGFYFQFLDSLQSGFIIRLLRK